MSKKLIAAIEANNKVVDCSKYTIEDGKLSLANDVMTIINLGSAATSVLNVYDMIADSGKAKCTPSEIGETPYLMIGLWQASKKDTEDPIEPELARLYMKLDEVVNSGKELKTLELYIVGVLLNDGRMSARVESAVKLEKDKERQVSELAKRFKSSPESSGKAIFDIINSPMSDPEMKEEYLRFNSVLKLAGIEKPMWDTREQVIRYYDETKKGFSLLSDADYRRVKLTADMTASTWAGKRISNDGIEMLTESYSMSNPINPVIYAYENLPEWDGEDHIARLASHFNVDGGEIEGVSAFEVCLKTWMKMSVARAFYSADPNAHERFIENYMLILGGPQNAGKSSLANWLATPFMNITEDTYQEVSFHGANNENRTDKLIAMSHCHIGEAAEINMSSSRISSANQLKADITARKRTFRSPYSKRAISIIPYDNYIGTWNNIEGAKLLTDPTGGRRFLCFILDEEKPIDWNYTQIDVYQVWAQAVYMYHNEALAPTEALKVWQKRVNEENTGIGLDFMLADLCEFDESIVEPMLVSDVIEKIKKITGDSYGHRSVCAVLRRLGAFKPSDRPDLDIEISGKRRDRCWVGFKFDNEIMYGRSNEGNF